MNLLKKVKQNPHYARGQKVMFDLRLTRWLDNLDDYSMFLVTLTFIIKILEVIGHKLHLKKYQEWKKLGIESRRVESLLGIFS